MSKQITQREARRLRKRVAELEAQEEDRRYRWGADYVGGTEIASASYDADNRLCVAVRTARRLRHAVVAVVNDAGVMRFLALPLAKDNR